MTITGRINRDTPLDISCAKYDINPEGLPKHIALIMDGNGRWAKERRRPRIFGHKAGLEALRKTITAGVELGVHYLSFYAFSTENWRRPKKEVEFLMKLLQESTVKEVPTLKKQGARVKVFGNISELSPKLQESIAFTEKETAHCQDIQVNLMINYGSRDEITQACRSIAEDYKQGNITEISEETIAQHLYTKNVPDPEIFVRTSGEHRISNYLLWQISYSELFFTPTLWPDFGIDDMGEIIKNFQNRDRRFGGLSS